MNTLEFFFGPVDLGTEPEFDTELDIDLEFDEYFYDEKGRAYYYKIVQSDYEFYIYDTCDRMMPVSREFIRSMNTAMFAVTQMYQADNDAQDLIERKYRETLQLVDFWNQEGRQ